MYLSIGMPFLCLTTMLSSSFGERWAFLIAGSKGYANYRHQADLFHAYHVLVAKNFSSDKIILMAYNDIAFDQRNPKPGKVFNRPYDRDVYANVQIDYQGENVTSEKVYSILTHFQTDRRMPLYKVLNPNKQDTVFIYMTGHGSVDFFYLPDDTILSGHILVTHLNQLATRCKSVLVIIESCNSGSLFQDRENILRHNILILTSADPRSPSFACYWTSDLMAYLGDEFSTAVFENLEKVDVRRETLSDLYLVTRIETQMSHVCVYGRKSQLKNAVSEYVGYIEDPYKTGVNFMNFLSSNTMIPKTVVAAPDAQIFGFYQLLLKDKKYTDQYNELFQTHKKLEQVFSDIMASFNTTSNKPQEEVDELKKSNCYEKSYQYFSKTCVNPQYTVKAFAFMDKFLDLCKAGYSIDFIKSQTVQSCVKNQLLINR